MVVVLGEFNFIPIQISGSFCPFAGLPCEFVSCCDAVIGFGSPCERVINGSKR